MQAAQVQLSYSELRAPISGRAGQGQRFPRHAGAAAATATPLVNIAQLDPISIAFNVPETELAALLAAARAGSLSAEAVLPGSPAHPATRRRWWARSASWTTPWTPAPAPSRSRPSSTTGPTALARPVPACAPGAAHAEGRRRRAPGRPHPARAGPLGLHRRRRGQGQAGAHQAASALWRTGRHRRRPTGRPGGAGRQAEPAARHRAEGAAGAAQPGQSPGWPGVRSLCGRWERHDAGRAQGRPNRPVGRRSARGLPASIAVPRGPTGRARVQRGATGRGQA